MTVLLDTCAWLNWKQSPDRLTFRAREAIDKALKTGKIYVSAASVWEIAVKAAKQYAEFDLGLPTAEWVASARVQVDIIDLDPEVLMASCSLPPWDHTDPFDRIIVAEARRLGVPLVTSDRKILEWPEIPAIW